MQTCPSHFGSTLHVDLCEYTPERCVPSSVNVHGLFALNKHFFLLWRIMSQKFPHWLFVNSLPRRFDAFVCWSLSLNYMNNYVGETHKYDRILRWTQTRPALFSKRSLDRTFSAGLRAKSLLCGCTFDLQACARRSPLPPLMVKRQRGMFRFTLHCRCWRSCLRLVCKPWCRHESSCKHSDRRGTHGNQQMAIWSVGAS